MRITTTVFATAFIVLATLFTGPANAAEEPVWTKGTVTRVKPDQSKVTIRHEEIKDLGMPAMKMVFAVDDPALLESLKEGDEREFHFVKEQGRFKVKAVKE